MTIDNDWKLVSISAVAPSLNALKKLPLERQAVLLLRRLATAFDGRSFGRMNFELPNYALDLVQGYAPNEAAKVKEYLLAAPWTYLVSHGYIVDNGQSFFTVTSDGWEAAKHFDRTTVALEISSALQLLHPDLRGYEHYFLENKHKEAVAAAFERYENRLNEIRDGSRKASVRGAAGRDLPPKLFQAKVLRMPYRKLGLPRHRAAYESALMNLLSAGVAWIRNAYTHEKHRLPDLDAQEAVELLFVASYYLRMVDYASSTPR